ncbi:DUF883 family protein [Desulfovibrio sp. ZJ200]|uniref:DUF883 family protein n=1 Tax=Desulfovibrio sp. ZJ200 TaxID=2709792 RepID=UPI0013EA9BF9|nr:DUF883 family protein [Desulfovibrio sp. ZJ200]
MAENNEEPMDALRNELTNLRDQVETLVKSLGESGSAVSSDLIAKLENELEHYRKMATDKMHQMYEAGSAGVESMGEHVRKHPLTCVAVAFGAGCVLSWLFRQAR